MEPAELQLQDFNSHPDPEQPHPADLQNHHSDKESDEWVAWVVQLAKQLPSVQIMTLES